MEHRLSSLSFGFLGDGSVLIGSMQRSRQSGDLALAFAREFTKQAHGLRPPSFLLETLRSMCGVWQIDTILGIDPVNHIKDRWNQRRKRLKFDYRALWREHGARLDGRGYWRLSTAAPSRDLSTVSSNKRSMYRKRFGLLEAMRAELLDVLRSSQRAAPAHR